MADATAAIFKGAAFTFATTTALDGLKASDIQWNPGDRSYVPIPAYDTAAPGANEIGNMPKLAGSFVDQGSFDVTFYLNPSVEEVGTAPASEVVTLTLASGTTWSFPAAWHPTGATFPMDSAGTLSLHIECLDKITIAPAA